MSATIKHSGVQADRTESTCKEVGPYDLDLIPLSMPVEK